jgi:hypothetical protein
MDLQENATRGGHRECPGSDRVKDRVKMTLLQSDVWVA